MNLFAKPVELIDELDSEKRLILESILKINPKNFESDFILTFNSTQTVFNSFIKNKKIKIQVYKNSENNFYFNCSLLNTLIKISIEIKSKNIQYQKVKEFHEKIIEQLHQKRKNQKDFLIKSIITNK